MPLHNSLRTRKTRKDGRKRTSSSVSNAASTQAGPVEPAKHTEQNASSELTNGSTLKPPAASDATDKPAEPAKPVPNVFEFLDDSDDSTSSESSDEEAPVVQTTVTKIESPKPRTSPVSHSLLVSKANISPKPIGSHSGEVSRSSGDSRRLRAPSPPPAPPTETQLQVSRKQPARKSSASKEYSRSTVDFPPSPAKRHLQISRPEHYYTRDSASLHRPPLPPSPPSSPEDSIHPDTPKRRRNHSLSQVSSGYGLVASHLTHSTTKDTGAFPPLYRRFASVNHRILLYLQDEISQMEEDLHMLDEYEEMHRVAIAEKEGSKPVPASRRLDAQSQSYSSLHYRRMDLMAALTQKTEQYSKP